MLVVGDCIVDEIRLPGGVRRRPGGAGLNLAVGLRILGLAATLVAPLAPDADGQRLRAHLREHRVELMALPGPSVTGVAVSDRPNGGEPRYRFNETLRHRGMRFGPEQHRAARAAGAVVVNTFDHDDDPQSARLRALAAQTGGLFALDPNPRAGLLRDPARFRANFEALVPGADLVKIGGEDVRLLYPGSELNAVGDRLRSLGARTVVLTDGPAGASVFTADGRVDEPVAVLPGPIVDTMGAGDATMATLLAHLVTLGAPADADGWRTPLRRAMRIAAATCRRPGGLLVQPVVPG